VTAGFYSPLPPARSGVADYAATLLTALRAHGRVEVAPRHCDVALYHLGNNALHAGIYRQALANPGVVVLHDAVLHHFLLGQLDRETYIEEFAYNYGDWNRGLAEELWRGRAASGADERYFQFPMLRRVAERARAVVVHNRAAASAVRLHAPHTQVVEIPHFYQPPELPAEAQVLRYREKLGLGAARFVFGVFGYLRESKRLWSVLDAFQAVRDRSCLLVAGRFVSADLERALDPLLAQPGIVRVPFLPVDEFWMAACAVDACINLRDPAAGETSGISIRLMGIGKPVLMTESGECAAFPEDGAIRIPAGLAERESLRQHIVLLTSLPEVARAIGERGAGHIREHHQIGAVARQYWETLCAYRG